MIDGAHSAVTETRNVSALEPLLVSRIKESVRNCSAGAPGCVLGASLQQAARRELVQDAEGRLTQPGTAPSLAQHPACSEPHPSKLGCR